MATAPAPVGQSHRITIIDSIRGIALLGILLMNIPFFANPFQYDMNLTLRNELSGINYYTWWVVGGFFEGTMRGLFTILFGAGCILLLNRLESREGRINPADIYYRRLMWLLLFGFINAFIFLWPGDILYSYALSGLFLFPFRKMNAKPLFIIGACLFILTSAKDTLNIYSKKYVRVNGEKALAVEKQKQTLSPKQEEAKAAWLGMQEKIKPENLRKEAETEISKMQQDYFGVWAHLKNVTIWLESQKFYSDFFPDIILLLFIGMALFKWGVLTGERSKRFYWAWLFIGYGLGLTFSYWRMNAFLVSNFDPTRFADAVIVDVYQAKRIMLVMGHLSLVMLLYKYGAVKVVFRWMSKVGQMAFTNYLMQSIFCATIFYGFGFGLYGKLERYEQYYVVGAIWLFQIIFSNIWLQYYRFGPFEWVWRSLTYWKKQPMKRKEEKEDEEPVEKEREVAVLV
ncbi:MAG TPA: DUF418 domain-containing protein [Chitinophagaceae bacterium]